jgi:hypothetical protein
METYRILTHNQWAYVWNAFYLAQKYGTIHDYMKIAEIFAASVEVLPPFDELGWNSDHMPTYSVCVFALRENLSTLELSAVIGAMDAAVDPDSLE